LLEGGTLHVELGRGFNYPPGAPRETQRWTRLVARLNEAAQEQRGWSELNQAVRQLLEAGDRQNLLGNQSTRKAYLDQAAVLLNGARTVARSLMQNSNPVLELADILLPGDIRINKVAGSIQYNRFSGSLTGS